jgi:hypothetical protein
MRNIFILILFISSVANATDLSSSIVGKWECDPYDVGENHLGFSVTHIVEYKTDGTSIDIHTYKMKGQEDNIWFDVAYSGPWKIEGNTLIEELDSTEIIKSSIPDLLHSKEILQAIALEDNKFVSDIIELSNSKLITKDVEYGEIGTCSKYG